MQALDKITARISTLSVPVGESRQFGTLEVTVRRCAFHPPEETPENAALVVIRDLGRSMLRRGIFDDVLSSPAFRHEHPVYATSACSADFTASILNIEAWCGKAKVGFCRQCVC